MKCKLVCMNENNLGYNGLVGIAIGDEFLSKIEIEDM